MKTIAEQKEAARRYRASVDFDGRQWRLKKVDGQWECRLTYPDSSKVRRADTPWDAHFQCYSHSEYSARAFIKMFPPVFAITAMLRPKT